MADVDETVCPLHGPKQPSYRLDETIDGYDCEACIRAAAAAEAKLDEALKKLGEVR